jgi:hypothetical protein
MDSFSIIMFSLENYSFKNLINTVYFEMFLSGHLKAYKELMTGNKTPAFRYHLLNINLLRKNPK